MSRKVLVISSSLRKNSNSEALADAFIKGAKESGNEVEKITLKEKSIAFCKGCMACQKLHRCVISDDAVEIVEKMGGAEILVYATPVYYYEMAGQLKTLLDRANPLFSTEYAFREVYLLAAAADDDVHAIDGAVKGMEGWVSCFEKAELKGCVFAGGADAPGEIQGHEALEKAYNMGKNA